MEIIKEKYEVWYTTIDDAEILYTSSSDLAVCEEIYIPEIKRKDNWRSIHIIQLHSKEIRTIKREED